MTNPRTRAAGVAVSLTDGASNDVQAVPYGPFEKCKFFFLRRMCCRMRNNKKTGVRKLSVSVCWRQLMDYWSCRCACVTEIDGTELRNCCPLKKDFAPWN